MIPTPTPTAPPIDFNAALERVAEAFINLRATGLNDRAIIVLLHDVIGQKFGSNAVPKRMIRMVLEAAADLPAYATQPNPEDQ